MAKIVLNENQAGLSLGGLFGLMHAAWVVLVGIGSAQMVVDWLTLIHFLEEIHTVGQFYIVTGVLGIIVAFVAGYATGWVFAWIWNFFGDRF